MPITEKSITMSLPTFVALIGLIASGIYAYGITQGDIAALKRDTAANGTNIILLNNKVDDLIKLLYQQEKSHNQR